MIKVIEKPAPAAVIEPPTGPILKHWWIDTDGSRRWLHGQIYNDPKGRFRDGEYIYTSTLKWLNEDAGLAQTLNTLYVLRDRYKA